MVLKAVVSDMDGVIVNTTPAHFESWKLMLAELGRTITHAEYQEKLNGMARIEGARRILPDLDDAALQNAADRKQELFLELIEQGIETYPSTISLLQVARAQGLQTAAVSSSRNCELILKSIELYDTFDLVVTGNDVERAKPDPQIFLLAAEKLGRSPVECIVLEDTRNGVAAAVRGGFPCIGIDRTNERRLLRGADLIVNDLAEVDCARLFEIRP